MIRNITCNFYFYFDCVCFSADKVYFVTWWISDDCGDTRMCIGVVPYNLCIYYIAAAYCHRAKTRVYNVATFTCKSCGKTTRIANGGNA